MNMLFDNEDTLIYLTMYIHKYNFYNMIENSNEIILPFEMLYNLLHTSKHFREIILDKKNKFPNIETIMLQYKREIVLPKFKQELIDISKRKPIVESKLKNIPLQLEILENRDKKKIYINYVKKTIHYSDCNYSFHPNDYYPNDNYNLEKMEKFFKENNYSNKDKISNFETFDIYMKNYYMFSNFKICNNSCICKCLNNEIKNYLKKMNSNN